ncbi:stage III sporulation protein AA [Tepidimicrobium xylanilyticum]|uniref:Stage III sporulation protein AA n=1 Tax=Tepidimicrobium xylanilyticum TaxID=1123352 RepID=A0A1H3CPV8_9FIRM|nr:stage III sporulation protein AA [Tepidimicrobium xylanilyticum]GMG97708.1 stage III sporulation protein AA [Tepidimicrobium xylanilyticum]SDX56282.1 stage III sporulation protein AA [Tepidimicrobium xylanilyticum]
MVDRGIDVYENILEYIGYEISQVLKRIPDTYKKIIEEIRLRYGSPINIYFGNTDFFVTENGQLTKDETQGKIVNKRDLIETFQLISNYSVYAFEEEIKNGFITLKGGHRVGLGGKVLYGVNGIETIRDISSLNIRIAKEKKGVSEKIIRFLIDKSNRVYNTLIVSPPQCGKTTMLRDLIRLLSNGSELIGNKGFKVGVIDERFELAGIYNGMPQFDIGIRTDVLSGSNKKDGTIMMIRAMSPEIIAMDEIGSNLDVEAIHEAIKAGIRIIATIHGDDLEDLISKRSLKILIEEKVFKRYIFLDNSKGIGTIKDIVDGNSFKSVYR